MRGHAYLQAANADQAWKVLPNFQSSSLQADTSLAATQAASSPDCIHDSE